jgi:hypothetical protein
MGRHGGVITLSICVVMEANMTKVFDLYGITDTDIDTAAQILPDALGMPFEPHDSSYWGEYYLARCGNYEEEFILKENYNQMEEDWNKPDFQQYPLLLDVVIRGNTVDRAKELEQQLKQVLGTKIDLLEREEFNS